MILFLLFIIFIIYFLEYFNIYINFFNIFEYDDIYDDPKFFYESKYQIGNNLG
jgi:hypothetical protein